MSPTNVIQSLNKAYFVATWVETFLYGINFILFSTCVYVHISRRNRTHRLLLISSTFMFCLATAHVIISFLESLRDFAIPESLSQDPNLAIHSITTPLNLTNVVIYLINNLSQDLLLIWRLYIIWEHNWKICIMPIIVEIVVFICALRLVSIMAKETVLFSPQFQAWAIAGWSLNILLNASLTCAIAFRLWQMGKRVSSSTSASGRNPYRATIIAVTESGVLFMTAVFVVLCLDSARNYLGLAAIGLLTQLATTTPLLIIFRLAVRYRNKSIESETYPDRVISLPPLVAHATESDINLRRSRDPLSLVDEGKYARIAQP